MTDPRMPSLVIIWLPAAGLQHWRKKILFHFRRLFHSTRCILGLAMLFLMEMLGSNLYFWNSTNRPVALCSVGWCLVIVMGRQTKCMRNIFLCDLRGQHPCWEDKSAVRKHALSHPIPGFVALNKRGYAGFPSPKWEWMILWCLCHRQHLRTAGTFEPVILHKACQKRNARS